MQVEWSPRAINDYLILVEYLLNEWGDKTTRKFMERLQTILNNISEKPEIYQATSKRSNVRRCVISRQTSLYYRVQKDKIELITLFDSRQSPSKRNI